MPYGISSSLWAMMSPEDQNQVINDYYKAQNPSAPAPVPTIGGYVQPTPQQVQQAIQQSGLPADSQQAVQNAYNNGGTTAPAAGNPSWVYAVNMPSTYPDFGAMKAAGAGLVIADDDPNFALLVNGARQWGVSVAINVAAHNGETPQAYAARVAAAQQVAPDKLVLDIESVGKGYEGSEGWNWAQQAATLLKPVVGSTSVAVSMEPNQADYNYGAFQGLSTGGATQYWVQAYTGDMTPYDPAAATAPAISAVGAENVVTIFGPNVPPPTNYTGGYISYGIPTTGASAAGIYAPGATSNTPYYPGQVPVAGAGSGATPGPPIYVNPGGQYGGGVNTPPPGSAPPIGNTQDWAKTYFQNFGLPADVSSKVNDIFKRHGADDVQGAIDEALAYIRGTPWYAQTFPGIQYGMQHGLITNEQDYRQYVTALDTLSTRYSGQHITSAQVQGYLMQGLTPEIVGKQFEGAANVAAYGQDYNYYLGSFGDDGRPTQQDLTALGQEQAGLDSPLGQKLNRGLQQAMQRYQKAFEGVLATPSLSLGNNGLTSPSLQTGRVKPDISA